MAYADIDSLDLPLSFNESHMEDFAHALILLLLLLSHPFLPPCSRATRQGAKIAREVMRVLVRDVGWEAESHKLARSL
jgi:hypothetical protein